VQEGDISSEFMNTKEVAKHVDIHEKQDYLPEKIGNYNFKDAGSILYS
jgi:hypothetical protein